VIPERLTELGEDLRWGIRRALARLRGRRAASPTRTPPAPPPTYTPPPAPTPAPPPPTRTQVVRRRRIVAVGVAVVVLVLAASAVFLFVPVPGLPCDVSPAKTCGTTDDAIALVPADAIAYLHVDLDRDSDQFSTAAEVARRLPHFEQIQQGIFAALGIAPDLNLRDDIGSWIGDEAALAAVVGGEPQPLALFAVKDEQGAKRFLDELGDGTPQRVEYGRDSFRAYGNGLAFTELQGFLVLGSRTAVKAAIAVRRNREKALSDAKPAGAVRDPLPDQRLVDLYISEAGIDEFLAGRGGLASQLDTFVDFGASRGIAAALVADDAGFELQIDSALYPRQVKANPSFFQAFPSFDPSLADEFSPDTLLFVDIADPAETVRALLGQAAKAAPELVEAFDRFEEEVGRGGIDIERGVLPVLSGEAAVGVELGVAPYVTAVFKDVDEDRAREQMARLQVPLVAALTPAQTGQAPSFESTKIGDTLMRRVRVSPTLDLAYAIFDGKLVVSSNPAGVRQAVEGDESLGGSDAFKAATSDSSGGVSALGFLNLEGLIRRSEPLGLDQIVRGFAEDVSRLKGLGLSVRSDEDSFNTTLFLNIEQPQENESK
jgi:hypothetical protein